jgi:hypothetical protein
VINGRVRVKQGRLLETDLDQLVRQHNDLARRLVAR